MSSLSASLAFPKWLLLARAGGIVVRWTWTISLLFLVVPAQEDLKDGRDEEQESVW